MKQGWEITGWEVAGPYNHPVRGHVWVSGYALNEATNPTFTRGSDRAGPVQAANITKEPRMADQVWITGTEMEWHKVHADAVGRCVSFEGSTFQTWGVVGPLSGLHPWISGRLLRVHRTKPSGNCAGPYTFVNNPESASVHPTSVHPTSTPEPNPANTFPWAVFAFTDKATNDLKRTLCKTHEEALLVARDHVTSQNLLASVYKLTDIVEPGVPRVTTFSG